MINDVVKNIYLLDIKKLYFILIKIKTVPFPHDRKLKHLLLSEMPNCPLNYIYSFRRVE